MEFVIGAQSISINLAWLRNNCRCDNCFNIDTNESKLTDVLVGEDVKHYTVNKENLQITWSDDHMSDYNLDWIRSQHRPEIRPKIITWDGREIENRLAVIDSEQSKLTEKKIATLLESVLKCGVAIVKNVTPSLEETEKICTQVAPIMNTFYGRMWQIVQEKFSVYKDSAYTNDSLGVHTDNTYAVDPAGIQVFHCLEPAEEGGETVLVDGFKAAEILEAQNKKYYQNLKTVPVEWYYNSKKYHHTNVAPIISTSKDTEELEQIRFNPYHRSPRIPFTKPSNLDAFYSSLKAFTNILNEPQMTWSCQLHPGSVIFINNWRILHGRKKFIGRRRLIGCYLSMNTILHRARVLKLII